MTTKNKTNNIRLDQAISNGKNLLYIANIRLPTEKAHGIQIMKMCEAFSKEGLRVELIVPWRFNPIKDNPYEYYNVQHSFKIKRIPSIDLVKFGPLGFWVQALSFSIVISVYLLFKQADVIYSRDELPLWVVSFLKKHCVWEAHTPRYNFFIESLLSRIDKVVVISGGLKKFYTDKGVSEKSISVQHDGVDTEQFTATSIDSAREVLNLPKEKKIVGYIGKYKTMSKAKGVDELIESFKMVHDEDKATLLLLVGINEEEIGEVLEKCNAVGLGEDAYRVVGHIPQKDIPPYLSASNVLVMNYPHAEHYALYMSPLKLFEYMSVERPIITTDLPVVQEVLSEKSAFFTSSDKADALTEAIRNVLGDQEDAFIKAKHARVDAVRYSWENRARNIISFIRDIK